jgi:hypothetical protein
MKKQFFLLVAFFIFLFINACKDKKTPPSDSVVPAAAQESSYIEFTSDPSGALVEIAVEIEGNDFKSGTGRQIGVTPVKTELKEDDVNDQGMVNFIMSRGGLTTIGQVKADKPPVAGKTYTYHQKY